MTSQANRGRNFVAESWTSAALPDSAVPAARQKAISKLLSSPAVVHFGGFEPNKIIQQRLQILNQSTSSVRVVIVAPATPYFRLKYDRKGVVAPGMSEDITVEFLPTEWKYYYDCIRVSCDGETMIVPLHGYPTANNVTLPRRVDFGTVPIGEPSTQIIRLRCSVPIEFEYELILAHLHADVHVSPLKGTIPADGEQVVKVTFTPMKMATVAVDGVLKIAQFGHEPQPFTITGSSAAGLHREKQLTELTQTLQTNPYQAERMAAPPRVGKGAGAAFDPGGQEIQDQKLRQAKARIAKKEKKFAAEQRRVAKLGAGYKVEQLQAATTTKVLKEVKFPAKLDSQKAVNFVLTQGEGKMKPQDMQLAVAKQRAERERQQQQQAEIRKASQGSQSGITEVPLQSDAGPGLSLGTILVDVEVDAKAERQGGDRTLREMVFLQDVSEIDAAERAREFQSLGEWKGEVPMVPAAVDAVLERRHSAAAGVRREQRDTDRSRRFGVAKGPQQVPPVRASVLTNAAPAALPTFDVYEDDQWRARKQVLLNLRDIVNTVLVRDRVNKRIARLKGRLQAVLDSRRGDAVQRLVDQDFKALQDGQPLQEQSSDAGELSLDVTAVAGSETPGADTWLTPDFMIGPPPAICRRCIAQASSAAGAAAKRDPVPAFTARAFNDVTPIEEPEATHAAVMQYQVEQTPVVPSHIMTGLDKALREGASDEIRGHQIPEGVDLSTAKAACTAEWSLASALVAPSHVPASTAVLMPDPGVRVQMVHSQVSEADAAYLLTPSAAHPFSLAPPVAPANDPSVPPVDANGWLVTKGEMEASQPGSVSLRSMSRDPAVSLFWRQSRDRPSADASRDQKSRICAGARSFWSPVALPGQLSNAMQEDILSDDSESDADDADGHAHPTLSKAIALFSENSPDTETKSQQEAASEATASEITAVNVAVARDRALLAHAEYARMRHEESAHWLPRRTQTVVEQIVLPDHKIADSDCV